MTNVKFNTAGIILMGIIFWITAQNGTPEIKKMINYFLFVLLASIILIRWDKIQPLLFKSGTTPISTKLTGTVSA